VPDFGTTIDIDAPAEVVWDVIVDVEHWPQWTATMTSVRRETGSGPLTVGERVRVRQPRLPPVVWTVTDVQPGRSFAWTATGPGVRSVGDHAVVPRPDGGGSTATVRFTSTGPLAGLSWLLLGRLTRRYVQTEAAGLKERSETRARDTD
jgi:uncharacterized protein YndB with AHSA1/START domain